MNLVRVGLISILFLLAGGVCLGQQPGPEFWRKLSCQPFEPRTKLEALELKMDIVVLRGFTQITTVEVRGVRIDAVEMRALGIPLRAKGIIVALRETPDHAEDNRAFVDYEEIDQLLNAIDSLARVDETSTKLAGFEAHYHTDGDLELRVFRQTRSGTAVTIQTGICNRATQALSLDELAKVKAMIQEAKGRLDELR
jgi:hypothetical protein